MDARAALFADHFLLQHVPEEEQGELLRYARERRCAAHETVFQRGDPGTSLMAVVEGRVRITLASESGKEMTLAIVEPGGLFGEIAIIDGKGRTADATAMTATRLICLDQRDFLPFLERHPRTAIRLLQVMCERVRGANQIAEGLVFLDLPGRLARLLLQLAEQHGTPCAHGRKIALKLSQSELANLVASSRESVNKQLRAWMEEGVIEAEKGLVTLRDEPMLRSLAEGER